MLKCKSSTLSGRPRSKYVAAEPGLNRSQNSLANIRNVPARSSNGVRSIEDRSAGNTRGVSKPGNEIRNLTCKCPVIIELRTFRADGLHGVAIKPNLSVRVNS